MNINGGPLPVQLEACKLVLQVLAFHVFGFLRADSS